MDAATEKHLAAWIDRQFGCRSDAFVCYHAVKRVAAEYPDIENGDRGWWRVYDIAKEKGYIKEDD